VSPKRHFRARAGSTVARARLRQDGSTEQLVLSVAHLARCASRVMTLPPGDIISTGTPSGVAPFSPGAVAEVEVEGVGALANPVMEG
jgi:2-keto-4-pentenoate hydratase/2-oxohepta-3-ene-1,7-dioic acid hydratase in catechol pathway